MRLPHRKPTIRPVPPSMLPFEVLFSVLGDARTNERARHGGGSTYTSDKTLAARDEIVRAFRSRQTIAGVHPGPVRLHVSVQHAAPEDKLWKSRFCKKKPDLDNVLKLVADALNGVAYIDDAQIIEMRADKSFAKSSALHVLVRFEAETEKPPHGRVKNPWVPNKTDIFEHGRWLGVVEKHGRFWSARNDTEAIDSSYPSGHWPTLTAAETAIREASL